MGDSRTARRALVIGWATRRFALPVLAALGFVAGLVARFEYILRIHHLRNHVIGYPEGMMSVTERMLHAPATQGVHDTIWSPGESAIMTWFLASDPTLGDAAVFNFVLSALTPLVIAHTALLVAGSRAACLALLFASLHFGLIHYGGFFLDEQPFQFAIAVTIWVTVVILKADEATPRTTIVDRPVALGAALSGAAMGACWGLDASFRPNALPVALAVGTALIAHALATRNLRRLWMLSGAAITLVLALVPVTHRCTTINASFCPGTMNAAMHLALGQAGEVAGLDFPGGKRPDLTTRWLLPALLQHGYKGVVDVHASIWDTRALLRWVWLRAKADPFAFCVRAVGNAFDLFQMGHWPDDYAGLPPRVVEVSKQAVAFFVVAPGLGGFLLVLRDIARRRVRSAVPIVFVATFAAVLLVAALSIGESRFRLPFDTILIVLGATLLTGGSLTFDRPVDPFALKRVAAAVATLAAIVVAGIGAIADPAIGLGAAFASGDPPPLDLPSETAPAWKFARRKAPGSAWNAPGTHRFVCDPDCTELRLQFLSVQHVRRVRMTLDWNDDYRVQFYRYDEPVGVADVKRRAEGEGLRVAFVNVPEGVGEGFDAIGVVPLFGDGAYSLGHVRLLPDDAE